MSKPISRRQFLKLLGVLAGGMVLGGGFLLPQCQQRKTYPGTLSGPDIAQGHQLREHPTFTSPDTTIRSGTVIVGGGVSGLSAAWWLQKQQYNDFVLLELEKEVGGNARSGQNAITSYPWGAHYIPVPNRETVLVTSLFEELGVITGYDDHQVPIYNDLYLCHDPEERLFKDGRWQEGLIPDRGLLPEEREEIEAFLKKMDVFRNAIGSDGKRAFAIPMALSSEDPEYRALDKLSMLEWMKTQSWHSRPLNWYVTYCCRDDYGSTPETVSAWAGIHYFSARRGEAANAEMNTVITWPEGNAWVTDRLKNKLKAHIHSSAMAYSVKTTDTSATVDYLDTRTQKTCRVEADHVIFAAPRFVAAHVVEDLRMNPPAYLNRLAYCPWMVANISLPFIPKSKGTPLAWDNVSYYSQGLGYVVATHQDISVYPDRTVITYYWPLSHLSPVEARTEAKNRSREEWIAMIVKDLQTMHPGIERLIEAIDVWVWGHGMIRPSVGYLWGEDRQAMERSLGQIHFAHSDMSGLSLFEEAQYHGVEAARRVLRNFRGD